MSMIQSRLQTAHIYNEETAREVAKVITENYFILFQKLRAKS